MNKPSKLLDYAFEYDHKYRIENIKDYAHAVFANKNIGGGVLGRGTLQEEIRYLICPECIIAMLLCFNQPMTETECISIEGAERFSYHEGYKDNFKILNPYVDYADKINGDNILKTNIIAFDALNYGTHGEDIISNHLQYDVRYIEREMKKLSSVFKSIKNNKNFVKEGFVTGNWGGGGFAGNSSLKFFLQWLVSSYYGIHIMYIGNQQIKTNVTRFINKNKFNTTTLYNYIIQNIHLFQSIYK